MMNDEKGQVLPLAMLALALGSLVITPFISYASSSLIGSRVHEEVITEQYSCDAGIEWALWKLKTTVETGELLTTSTTYDAAPLEPFPGEINSSSFPTTEIRFIEESEDIETIILEWETEPAWKYEYLLDMAGPVTVSLTVETEVGHVMVWLGNKQVYNSQDPPDGLVLQIEPDDPHIIRVQTPAYTGLVTMVVTIRYPAAIYDIRAQQDNSIITARAEASCLRIGVISWQVE